MPWLVAALALVGLIVGALAALEIVTATHRPLPVPPVTWPAPVEPGSGMEPNVAEC